MNETIRKHWTSLLGVLLILSAFVTLFQYSIHQGWITEPMKIGFGLVSGLGFALGGIQLAQKLRKSAAGEILIGLGACILYATFSFAGIAFDLWTPMTVLLGMSAVTALVSVYAFRFDSRLLMNIALAGGLLSPMLMLPETDQVFTLFLYLLVLNGAFFFLSIIKGWTELRSVAFIGTWVLYAIYFVLFNPSTDGLWSMPIRYAIAAFLFYHIGFLVSSWRLNRCFDGWNLYLSLTNGVMFSCWALYILAGDLPYATTVSFVGLLYLVVGIIVYRLSGRTLAYAWSHGLGGGLLLLISIAQAGSGMEAKPLLNVFLWGGIAVLLAAYGRRRKHGLPEVLSVGIWLFVGLYWFAATWDAPRGEWFGVFIPFLNWGALSWMLLAVLGFYYAVARVAHAKTSAVQALVSNVYALLAHLIVGGLLTVQIVRTYEAYGTGNDTIMGLTLSVTWGIYALLLILWGAYSKQNLFRWFGSIVLVAVALKAIFLDLSGEETLFKVLVLLILGGISFLITWVNGRWSGAIPVATAEANRDPLS